MKRPEFEFATNCINSDYDSIQELVATEEPIARATFAKKIGPEQWKELQQTLGYDRDFPISKDWHVGYYKGVYRGLPAVFLRWSRIEYIFVQP